MRRMALRTYERRDAETGRLEWLTRTRRTKPIKTPGLPMVIEAPRPRPSLVRNPTTATFVSHLLVAHHKADETAPNTSAGRWPPMRKAPRSRRRRMPQGYRKTVIA